MAAVPKVADQCWWVPPRFNLGLDYFSRITLGAVAAFLWLVWILMMWHGAPPPWPIFDGRLPHDFQPRFDGVAFALAAGFTGLFFLAQRSLAHVPARALVSWATGIALCWTLLANLWMPWIDYAKSYRGVFQSMSAHLPSDRTCMASYHLGESERAMHALRGRGGHRST